MHRIDYMRCALSLAEQQLGRVAPNPAVGAVIVNNGRIVGSGVTARGGRPHAETQAITTAGESARGATLYVTLEPCSHHGKTPPCAEAIVRAGIAHVFVACGDSNPLVAGKGIALLRQAGVTVTEGVCEAEARMLNEGFFSVVEKGRPLVTVKIATSLDGRTITHPNEGRWITGEAARERGHVLRATHDAILTGIGTVLADNPALTCRLPGRQDDSPQRIVLDSALRTPPDAAVLPAWIVTTQAAITSNMPESQALINAGARLVPLEQDAGRPSLSALLTWLASEGITRLLVEGGKTLTEAFLGVGLVDYVYWFRSPRIMGVETSRICLPFALEPDTKERLGGDILEISKIGSA